MLRSSLSAVSALFLATTVMAADAGWVQRAPLTNARFGHQALLLDNGSVMVAGGYGLNDYELTSEIYNPTANTWSAPTGMAHIHYSGYSFALVPLPNHHVLAVDANQDGESRCEEYDPVTATWATIAPLPDDRYGFKTVALDNGDILVAGGYTGDYSMTTLSSCWLYDATAGTWSQTGSLAISRGDFTMNMLGNGQVLVTGGLSEIEGSGFITSSCETYLPESGTWQAASPMSTFRWQHQACVLRNGHVVAVSGVSDNLPTSEEFAPKKKTWTATNDCTVPYEATFTAFRGGALRAGGGPWWQSGVSYASVDLFNERTHTWNPAPALHEARRLAAAVSLSTGEVLVVGGTGNGFDALTGTELFGLAPRFTHLLALAEGQVGHRFNFAVQANAVATYAAKGLPKGLKFNQQTGELSGKPTRAGIYLVPITAKNAFGKAKMLLVIFIAPKNAHGPAGNG